MDLIFLHGPPASGKYTIAKELERRAGFGVFHNHLTIDAARPLFEFGTPAFWTFVHDLRKTCLEAAAQHSSKTVVYTSCYDHPADLDMVESYEHIIESNHGEFIPVYLACPLNELEARVVSPSRKDMGKIQSISGLHKSLQTWNCMPVPRSSCIMVDTEQRSPAECADYILEELASR